MSLSLFVFQCFLIRNKLGSQAGEVNKRGFAPSVPGLLVPILPRTARPEVRGRCAVRGQGEVATGAGWDSLGGVQPLKKIVAVLVLAVWGACTADCVVENLRGGAGTSCCKEDGGPSDQAPHAPRHCICGAIAAGGYVSQDGAISIPLPLDGVLLFVVAPEPGDLPTRPGIVEPASSPPGSLEPWQFSLRAALMARAPSLVS
jgi:hypothetical protein